MSYHQCFQSFVGSVEFGSCCEENKYIVSKYWLITEFRPFSQDSAQHTNINWNIKKKVYSNVVD